MGRREEVPARAHKGAAQGGQVGGVNKSRRSKATAALRGDRALADTPSAPFRLLVKSL